MSTAEHTAAASAPASERPSPSAASPAAASTISQTHQPSVKEAVGTSECPFCVMMRKGGCEAPFVAFMECGERAEKDSAGGNKFKDCVEYFDALQACMSKNKSVYDEILAEMASIEEGVDKKAAEGASEASEAQAAAGAQTR